MACFSRSVADGSRPAILPANSASEAAPLEVLGEFDVESDAFAAFDPSTAGAAVVLSVGTAEELCSWRLSSDGRALARASCAVTLRLRFDGREGE
jgi:hypothetical protein